MINSPEGRLPRYADLPTLETGDAHAWDVWGRDNQLGAINLLTPERVLAATRLVRRGQVINLNLPLNFDVGMYGDDRGVYEHRVRINRGGGPALIGCIYLPGNPTRDGCTHAR